MCLPVARVGAGGAHATVRPDWGRYVMRRSFVDGAVALLARCVCPAVSEAGTIFVTGHDPDFHAAVGGNAPGAQHIIQLGLSYVRNGNTAPILVLQTNTTNIGLGDHTDSVQGLIASGYTAGNTP